MRVKSSGVTPCTSSNNDKGSEVASAGSVEGGFNTRQWFGSAVSAAPTTRR
jgi:hypothetical protein